MNQRERARRYKREEPLEEGHHRKKVPESSHDRFKATDDGVTDFQVGSSFDTHAALLAGASTDAQRSDLAMHLQKTYGNRYVQRLVESTKVQAKLTVSSPDDVYEKEANQVADVVTRASTSNIQRQLDEEELVATKQASGIQRQVDEEELVATKRASDIQRQEEEEMGEEEEEVVSAKRTSKMQQEPFTVSEDIEADINAARGSGQPLPDSLRESLEPQLGHDFGQVHIHTDAQANRLSQQLGAEAFTTGSDVFFREGTYQPGSDSGKGLIAHELTHVVQQSAAPALQRQAATETQTEAAAPAEATADVEEKAVSEVNEFADKLVTELDIAIIKGLLHGAALCYKLGMESVAEEALRKAAEKASQMLERKIIAFNPKSATEDMAKDLLDAAAKAMALGGDEKAIETALEEVRKQAETQLASLVTELKETQSPEVAIKVANKAADVMMLGGEATDAVNALNAWQQKSPVVE